MKAILEQYGKGIIAIVVAVVITVLISSFSYKGNVGLINIVGINTGKLADNDTLIEQSAPNMLLESQKGTTVPEFEVHLSVYENETVNISKLLTKVNDAQVTDVSPTLITTDLNNPLTDAVGMGLVTIDGRDITFKEAGTYYLTVDIRQENRIISRTFRIKVQRKV